MKSLHMEAQVGQRKFRVTARCRQEVDVARPLLEIQARPWKPSRVVPAHVTRLRQVRLLFSLDL